MLCFSGMPNYAPQPQFPGPGMPPSGPPSNIYPSNSAHQL